MPVKVGRCHSGEPPLHRVDLREVGANVVVAATLAVGQTETARRIGVARPRPAQVDHGGQILLPLGRGGGDPGTLDGARDTAIQKGRGHFDGVTRHDAAVEEVEPARGRVEPRAILHRHVAAMLQLDGAGPLSEAEAAERLGIAKGRSTSVLRHSRFPLAMSSASSVSP